MNGYSHNWIHLKDHEYSLISINMNNGYTFFDKPDVKYGPSPFLTKLLDDIPHKFHFHKMKGILEIFDPENCRFIAAKLGMKYVISCKSWSPSVEVIKFLSDLEHRYVVSSLPTGKYIINLEDYDEAVSLLMRFDNMELKESKINT